MYIANVCIEHLVPMVTCHIGGEGMSHGHCEYVKKCH